MINSIKFVSFSVSFDSLHLHVLDFLKEGTVYFDSRLVIIGQYTDFVQRIWILKYCEEAESLKT